MICTVVKMSVRLLMLILMLGAGTWSLTAHQCGPCTCKMEGGCMHADCSYTKFWKVPPQVPDSICTLSLRGNKIQELGDNTFERLVNLTELDLSENNISRMSYLSFSGLTHLRKLNLSDNKLEFHENVSLSVFEPLVELIALELKVNRYSDYPSKHLQMLRSLESISLDGLNSKVFGDEFSVLSNLSILDLAGVAGRSSCNLRFFGQETFRGVSMIRKLNISNCGLCYSPSIAYQNVLKPFRNLEVLDLSFNENLSFQGFLDVTEGMSPHGLRELYMNRIVNRFAVCVILGQEMLSNLLDAPLEIIEANDNLIDFIHVNALEKLPSTLKHVILGNTRLSAGPYLKHLVSLSGLMSLRLSGSRYAIDLFYEHDTALYPSLIQDVHDMKMSCNYFETYSEEVIHASSKWWTIGTADKPFSIPQHLERFEFAFAELYFAIGNVTMARNSLTYIDLSYNVLTSWIGPIRGLENVTYLDLSNNFARSIAPSFFENFDSLLHLNISWNQLGRCLRRDVNGTIFSRLNNLLLLDLTRNDITHLPKYLFKGLHSLQVLKLSQNNIRHLSLQYNTNMNLRFINMSFNDIDFLSQKERYKLDIKSAETNLSIDFTNNPFECTCDKEKLLDWLQMTQVVINRDQLRCIDDTGKSTQLGPKYTQLKHVCREFTGLLTVLTSLVILLLCCVTFGVAYRFRWWIIYWYFVGKRKFHRPSYEPVYDFDAFVSYADADVEFVRPLMLSRLESDQGLKLYIRHRDSIPGDGIADGIIDAIQRSRKCILLMSKASLARKWCRYELQMANVEQISSKRDTLIIVLLEVVPNDLIPSEVLYHMKTNSPLEYPSEDHTQTDVFWSCLTESIRSGK